ncbi:MAG: Zn-dependent protease [Planctomycetota bacterium]|jgi:Zn-dependent protease
MEWEKLITLFLVLIFSLTFHEAAHGLFAWLGGDRTAKDQGLVTLNPIPHMRREPIGMVLIPIAILYLSNGKMCFGGASAPIDPYWAARHPKKAALMSAAGPLANMLLVAIAFTILHFVGKPNEDTQLVFDVSLIALKINLLLAIFNLLPLPPFDGAGVVGGLVPAMERLFRSYVKIPYYSIISMVIGWQLLPYMVWPVYYKIREFLPAVWK